MRKKDNVYCCINLHFLLLKDTWRIVYSSFKRQYLIKNSTNNGFHTFFYCFFCGTKLPDGLTDIWEETIKKELKIDDPWDALYEETLPEEFMTDQWWKNRNL